MFEKIQSLVKRVAKDEEGASLVEYALIVALIAVVCIAAVTIVGSAAKDKLGTAGNALAAP